MMLRKELKSIKLPIYGRKAELIERLKSDDAQKKKNGILKECKVVLGRVSHSIVMGNKPNQRLKKIKT